MSSSLILFVLATQLWAIKIGEPIGTAGIQMNCTMKELWSTARGGGNACFRNLFIWAPRSFLCFKARLPFIRGIRVSKPGVFIEGAAHGKVPQIVNDFITESGESKLSS